MKLTQIKDSELDKYKNLAQQLANEVEHLLNEIEQLKTQITTLKHTREDETTL
jgi:uncharacterized coiled-coil DUF342 family protein